MKKNWSYITNLHIPAHIGKIEKEEAQRLNRYAFIVGCIWIINSVVNYWINSSGNFIALFILGIFYLIMFFFTKVHFNPLVNLFKIEFALLVIFFFSSTAGFDNGLSFYYFFILIASVFVFNKKSTVWYNGITFITAFILFTISHLYDFKVFGIESVKDVSASNYQRYVAFIQLFAGIFIFGFFGISKHFKILRLSEQMKRSESAIVDLKSRIDEQTKTNGEEIEKIVKLAVDDAPAFVSKFKEIYPDFLSNLKEKKPDLTLSEFKFCALLKLGFTTKEIAEFNHLSVRTVQTKKARLRKSFNIPSEEDLYVWVEKIWIE